MRRPSSVGAIAGWNVRSAHSARAFTLIDILVSLSVIALLISLMLPTLAAAQEAARRVACAQNMRQQGLALQNYAFAHLGDLPSSVFDAHDHRSGPTAEETIFLRLDRGKRSAAFQKANARRYAPSGYDDIESVSGLAWDGLGKLYAEEYVNHHACFYCPSHRGQHAEHVYHDLFLGQPDEHLTQRSKEIAGNYQLRLGLKRNRLYDINPVTALVSDAVRTQVDYNHIAGNNVFRADLSVTWYSDTNGKLWNTLASGDEEDSSVLRSAVGRAWQILDGNNFDPIAPR